MITWVFVFLIISLYCFMCLMKTWLVETLHCLANILFGTTISVCWHYFYLFIYCYFVVLHPSPIWVFDMHTFLHFWIIYFRLVFFCDSIMVNEEIVSLNKTFEFSEADYSRILLKDTFWQHWGFVDDICWIGWPFF